MERSSRFFKNRGIILACFFFLIIASRYYSSSPLNFWGLGIVAIGWGLRSFAAFYISIDSNSHVMQGKILARTGPYGFSRNPIYLGNIIVGEGFILFSNCFNFWQNLFLIGCLIFIYQQVIKEEEKYLQIANPQYKNYLKESARWLGFPSKNNNWKPISHYSHVWKLQRFNFLKSLFMIGSIAIIV